MSTVQYPPGTIGERLGIVRVISKTMDGEAWTFGYNAAGGLATMMPSEEYATMVLEECGNAVSLEFQDLFKTDDGGDDSFLDDNAEASHVPDPIGDFVRRTADDALRKNSSASGDVDPSWSEIIGVEKSEEAVLPATGTLAKRLGIVRTEKLVIDCGVGPEQWLHGFNSAGELVDARLISQGGHNE